MKLIRPITVTAAMLVSSSVSEPDSAVGETAWSSTEICTTGMERTVSTVSGTVTISNAAPAVVTWTANFMAVGQAVVLTTSGTLPAPLVAGQIYYVRARLTVDAFTLTDTPGGRAITTSSAGSGTHTCTADVHRVYEAVIGKKITVTGVNTTTDTLSYTSGESISDDEPLVFQTSGGLPAPLTADTLYYAYGPAGATLQVSSTVGGGNVNLTTSGTGTHYIGQAGVNGPNWGKGPSLETNYWTEVARSNRWGMLDGTIGAVTTAASSIAVVLRPGQAFDAFALLQVSASTAAVRMEISRATVTADAGTDKITWTAHGLAADTPVRITTTGSMPGGLTAGTTYYVKSPGTDDMQLAATAGGAAINITSAGTGTHTAGHLVYSADISITSDSLARTALISAANLVDAAYADPYLTVTLTSSGTVSCGELVIGTYTDLGDTDYGTGSGIKDYSLIERDDFGNVTVTPRAYTKRLSAQSLLASTDVDSVAELLAEIRATPVVLVGADALYGVLVVYGLITDWELSIVAPLKSRLRLEAEGLT